MEKNDLSVKKCLEDYKNSVVLVDSIVCDRKRVRWVRLMKLIYFQSVPFFKKQKKNVIFLSPLETLIFWLCIFV